jgi:hypothetical protein
MSQFTNALSLLLERGLGLGDGVVVAGVVVVVDVPC